MRISDWSSDVCSSDLINEGLLTILVDDVDFSDVRRMRMLLDFVDSNSKNRFFFTSLQHDSVSGPAALGDAVVLKTGANVSFDQIFLKPLTRLIMRKLVKKWGQEANLDEEENLKRRVVEMADRHIIAGKSGVEGTRITRMEEKG